MSRKPTPTRISRLSHAPSPDSGDGLTLPVDWDDSASRPDTGATSTTDALRSVEFEDDDDGGAHARRMQAIFASAPPTLVKAMFALDRAKSEDDIAAARAILRVASF